MLIHHHPLILWLILHHPIKYNSCKNYVTIFFCTSYLIKIEMYEPIFCLLIKFGNVLMIMNWNSYWNTPIKKFILKLISIVLELGKFHNSQACIHVFGFCISSAYSCTIKLLIISLFMHVYVIQWDHISFWKRSHSCFSIVNNFKLDSKKNWNL